MNKNTKPCIVDGCETTGNYAKGMCAPHYGRWYRHGGTESRIQTTSPICVLPECAKKTHAKGLCSSHYNKAYRAEISVSCLVDDCDGGVHSAGLCTTHYWRLQNGKDLYAPLRARVSPGGVCSVENCEYVSANGGLCRTHYDRNRRGEEDWRRPIKKKAPNGSGHTDKDGYRVIYVDGKVAREHIIEFEKVLGRKLKTRNSEESGLENVHHVNGNRSDNRTDGPPVMDERGRMRSGNLELWSTAQPPGQEIGPKLEWALDLLAEYGGVANASIKARAREVLGGIS